MNLEEIHRYKEAIMDLANENMAERVRVFGSVSRNTSNENSDIDLLVKFKDGASYFDLVRLNRKLEELLNNKVDIVSEDAIKKSYANHIYSDLKDL